MTDAIYDSKREVLKQYKSSRIISYFSKVLPIKERPLTEKEPSAASEQVEMKSLSVYSGVAFWLHFSVIHGESSLNPSEDRRILPVHYTENYFSLVPGEKMNVEMSFKLPEVGVPKLVLEGWNIKQTHVSLKFA
eukprot:c31890_g1_i1 orf=92-493(-)